jgi:methionine-rich copper-binding protein CopC
MRCGRPVGGSDARGRTAVACGQLEPRKRPLMMRPRSLAAAIAVAALTLSTVGVLAAPASAHDQLLASNPADGAVVAAAPTEVQLDFSDTVLDLGGAVIVADRDGTNWADGGVSISESRVTQKLRPGAPDGAYQIRWRVVSVDGHPISDVVDYSVGDTAAAPITANQSSGAEPAESPAESGDTAEKKTAGSGMPPALLFAGLGVGGAVVGVGVYLLITLVIRRRRAA